jgi:hypothetical protein
MMMMMMIVVQSVECKLAGETKVLGKNMPQCHFVHNKSHDLTRAQTQSAMVGSQQITARAMAWPGWPLWSQ